MRIENTRAADILRTDANMDIRGSNTVSTGDAASQKQQHTPESACGVKSATVEKALFSFDSELDRIKQMAENVDVDALKKQMAILSNTVSGEDLKKLEEGGYSLNDTQVDTIVTAMDKIKMELAKGGMDISVFGESYSLEQLKAITGGTVQARQMASSLTNCDDNDIKYMLDNELDPTVENLYRAEHSGSKAKEADAEALKREEGLCRQVEQMIRQAGLPVNDATLGYGSFLLNNEIPVTPENLSFLNQLKGLQLPVTEQALDRAMTQAAEEGKAPKDALLLDGYTLKERAQAAAETVEAATDENLRYITEHDMPMNLNSIRQAQNVERDGEDGSGSQDHAESASYGISSEEVHTDRTQKSAEASGTNQSDEVQRAPAEDNQVPVTETEFKMLKARRQLEEIRLAMTVEANYQLLKQGISIETEELEQLVEQLKSLEQNYYESLLNQNGLEPTEQNISLLSQTTEKTAQLREMPAYALGRYPISTATIEGLHEAGSKMKSLLEAAGRAYDTMMTTPRADLGDSIQKAFQNVDDILQDLNLEITPANQRAVRILGYNGSEITPDSIAGMKAADQKVQLLMDNLTPSVVMELIREGINPLETDVNTLNAKVEEIRLRLDPGQEEKYSKYLWKLEQKQEITAEERESYIGIYRMLHQIDKTDGAVIGALVNQGGELSLRNLLTGVRTGRARGMDVRTEEGFGGTEEIIRSEPTITQQVEAAYQTDCAKEAFGRLTQEGMEQCMARENWQDMTPEQLLWQLKQEMVQEENQESYYTNRMQEFRAGQETEASVMRMLIDYDIPVTTYNLLAAEQMNKDRNLVFRRIFDKEDLKNDPDLTAAKEKLLADFAEAVKTPEDMAKAQQALAETAEHAMENMINEVDLTSLDVRDLKILRRQIELGTRMSKEENYAIPVMIADEMTNVQLKIVRGKEKTGRVDIMFQTDRLGKISARIQAEKNLTTGYAAVESGEALSFLEGYGDQLQEALEQAAGGPVRMDYIQSDDTDLPEYSQAKRKYQGPEKDTQDYRIQTARLYGMAKSFLEAVRVMGDTAK